MSDDGCTLDGELHKRSVYAMRREQWGECGVCNVHGTVPAPITAVHCAVAIQYSLPHWNGGNIK